MQWVASIVVVASTVMAAVQALAAPDCPTAQSAHRGFVVERDGTTKTEVFAGQDGTVRTTMRLGGKALLETTQFRGVFQLDRLDEGRRAVFRPKTDLAPLFPLKVGQNIEVEFDLTGPGQAATATIALSVKEADTLYIGPCRYDVLKIERRESRGSGALRFIDTDYYAPALNLIIAKEYRYGGDRTRLIKFDRIYPLKR
jgi:hypothetical protein